MLDKGTLITFPIYAITAKLERIGIINIGIPGVT